MAERETTTLPTGTVTFLFTDVEGSTRRASELGDEAWAELLEVHNRLLRDAFEARGGVEVKTDGDAFFVAFERATHAAIAAVEGQRALATHDWPDGDRLRVRMGLHTGEAIIRDDDYVGHDVHRASRICDAGHGGQILVSEATSGLVRDHLPDDASLTDLGLHRLKDLGGPQQLFAIQTPDLPSDFPPLRTLEAVPNNLPMHRSAFIGREGEIARVRKLLETHPLVTLSGIGGCGKTRLALQVGAEELDRFPGGVFFVDLAPLADPDLVAGTTADAAGLQLGGARPALDLLVDALARRTCLLVVDNCEHLLDACADLVDRVLVSCPDVRVLATSREPLGVEAEQVYRVPSLSVPDGKGDDGPSEAVDLFVERATTADPDFELTADNHQAVAAICRRLDGIPLAIEFAAARVSHLSPQRIAERLDDRFRLLTGGRRRIRRQQTLEAALDWSHDLLGEAEQILLRRLAVFAGDFPLDMAEEICSGDGVDRAVVIDLLGSLVDKSLVVTEPADGDLRYRLLETIRSYAEAKLEGAGEAEAVRSRHRDAYLAWLESMSWDDLYLDADVVAALVSEHDNLRAAMAWSQAQARRDLVGRLAARAASLWYPVPGHGEEGHRWLTWALEEPGGLDPPEQAACFVGLAAASLTLAEPEMEEHAARAMELGRGVLDRPIVGAAGVRALAAGGRAVRTGDPDVAREARALADEGVQMAEKLGRGWPAYALFFHGMTVLGLDDLEAAERSLAAADAAASGRAVPWYDALCAELAACRLLLGDTHGALDAAGRVDHTTTTGGAGAWFTSPPAALAEVRLGRPSDAAANLRAGIRLAESEGIFLVANYCLLYAGAVAYEAEDAPRAARLLAAAVRVGDARETSIPGRSPGSGAVYRHYVRLVRGALGPEEARRCRDEGRAMTEGEALTEARELAEALRDRVPDGPGET